MCLLCLGLAMLECVACALPASVSQDVQMAGVLVFSCLQEVKLASNRAVRKACQNADMA